MVAVTPDVSAIEAMSLMNDSHISAVAVVDSVGKIIGGRAFASVRFALGGCGADGAAAGADGRAHAGPAAFALARPPQAARPSA